MSFNNYVDNNILAWLGGYIDAVGDSPPTLEQWDRLKSKIKEFDSKPVHKVNISSPGSALLVDPPIPNYSIRNSGIDITTDRKSGI